MQLNGVLINDDSINWDFIKSQIEIMYSSIPTVTMDLYKLNLNQEDILNFNKDYDSLTIAVKGENKQDVLSRLANIYSYIPKFMKNTSESELSKKVIETKANVLNGYSKLDSGDWKKIGDDINKAIEIYSQLLASTNIENGKQYSVSRGYIMLNELQNAVNIKDVQVFLIKYKNLLEEFENL